VIIQGITVLSAQPCCDKKTPNPEQERKADSLRQLIGKSPDDTNKVMLVIALANTQKNMETGEAAANLASKLHYLRGQALAYQVIAGIYQDQKNYKKAMDYYQFAMGFAKGDLPAVKGLYSCILNLYFYLGDYPNAMKTVTGEMNVFERSKDRQGIANCHNLLGYIHFKQENFQEAEKYYKSYISDAKEMKDTSLLAHAWGEIADMYTAEKEYGLSTHSLFNVLQLCNLWLDSVDNLRPGKKEIGWLFPQYKTKLLYRFSRNLKFLKGLPAALKYSLDGIRLMTKYAANEYDSASYYINAGDIYKEMGDYPHAVQYLLFGFNISKRIQHRENTRDGAEYLSQVYALQKKYDSAFFFYQLYTGLKDSIVNNETKMKIAGIQGQFDVAKKDKEIFRQRQLKNVLIGVFVFFIDHPVPFI
jgi:tetratricopeptide (TPR) repeat protein